MRFPDSTISCLSFRSALTSSTQQRDLGQLNGCIEETMTGQKVVKVFCHEEESLMDMISPWA